MYSPYKEKAEMVQKKYSEKATSPNKQKEKKKKKEARVAIGTPAYRGVPTNYYFFSWFSPRSNINTAYIYILVHILRLHAVSQ